MSETDYVFERKLVFTLVFRNTQSTIEAKKKISVMFSAMRQQANKCNWLYKAFVVIYEKEAQIKAQLIIHALPISTIREWICDYFKRYGRVQMIKPISDELSLLLITPNVLSLVQGRGDLS